MYQGVVKPLSERTGHEFVEFVAQHVQPYTVGWGNIIDYMRLEQVWFKGIIATLFSEVSFKYPHNPHLE